ncbi:MAG: hypothetical protein ACFBZ8_02105 [Opitutales bacterium]
MTPLKSEAEGAVPMHLDWVTLVPRSFPQAESHFLCRTREGLKALYDEDVFEHLRMDEVVPVLFRAGADWAVPAVDRGPLSERVETHVRRRVQAQVERRRWAALGQWQKAERVG